LSGVEASQEELDTTGNNISNANSPDYEEQVVNSSSNISLDIPAGAWGKPLQLGTGVDATSITNQDDPYLNAAWRQQNSNTAAADTTQSYTQQIDAALDEPSNSGISAQMTQFWQDWSALAENPTSTAAKQAIVDDANTLAGSFNQLSSEISGSGSGSIQSQAVAQYNDMLGSPTSPGGAGEVYNDSQNIAQLNEQIVDQSKNGGNPNALIDERNAYVDDLSSLGSVTVVNNTDGSVNVSFGGVPDPTTGSTTPVSQLLVDGTQGANGNDFTQWNTQFNTQAAAYAAGSYATANPTTAASTLASSFGGTLGALIGLTGYPVGAAGTATIQGTIGQVQSQLDAVANDLGQNVNNPDSATGTPPGSPTPLTTPLFGTTAGQSFTAADLSVNTALLTDPSQLQAGTGGGDGSIATAEAAIGAEQGLTVGGTNYPADPYGTTSYPTSAYSTFVQFVGSTAQGANENDQTQSALQTQLTNQRTSAEGVDLSQEMTNLIEEQQAYEASAKVMNTFSTMMDSLMTVVGQ
jgi:flagellar hook-associated protein 1 FlgK